MRLLLTTGANAGASIPGTLAIDCELPGASFAIEEGIQLAFQRFELEQAGGGTLLHLEHQPRTVAARSGRHLHPAS